MSSALDEKWRTFTCFLQSREQVVVRWGQTRRIGWVIETLEAQVGHFLLGCKCLVSRGIEVQEQDPLGELLAAFSFKISFNCTSRDKQYSGFIVWPFGRWSMRGMPSWSQKIEARTFPVDFCTQNFLGGGLSRFAATPFIIALSPGHSNITRFRPWLPIKTGNHLDRAEKNSKSCSGDWHCWRFWSAFRHFGTHFAESFRVSKSSWMMDPTRSREMPSCSVIDLAEIRRSSKISSWIWSIISGVVNVLGRPGRGATHVEKSIRLNSTTQFFLRW